MRLGAEDAGRINLGLSGVFFSSGGVTSGAREDLLDRLLPPADEGSDVVSPLQVH